MIGLAVAALLLGGGLPLAEASSKATTKKSSSPKVTTSKKKKSSTRRRASRRGSWKRRGQQKIESQRVREIQEALIRENYLEGKATGVWDDRTRAAMTKYQADHGWQAKITPDSRALIKLGLGPSMAGLLNPTTAILPTAPVAGGGEAEQVTEEEEEDSEPEEEPGASN